MKELTDNVETLVVGDMRSRLSVKWLTFEVLKPRIR